MKPRTVPNAIAIAMALVIALATGLRAGARAQPAGPERDLLLAADNVDTYIVGRQEKDQLGNDLRAGDLNGDGTPDLVLGAHWGSLAGRNIQGRTYVKFGAPDWPAQLDLAQLLAPSWSFMGTGFESRLGSAVATGDLSGDGTMDLVLGSVLADPYGQANGGGVYVMFGGPTVGGHVDFLNAQPDAFLAGASHAGGEADRMGTDLTTGDYNDDGHVDLAVAAVFRDDFAGAIFVWWGPLARGSVHNLQTAPADWTILGPAPSAFLGAALASGDINGDGVDDLLASAYKPSAEGTPDRGAVHGFLGGAGRGGVSDLAAAPADLTVVGPAGAYMGAALSPGSCSCRGQSLTVAELTGDGAPDLLAGAPLADNRLGGAFLVPGPFGSGTVDLGQGGGLRLRGTALDGRLGWSVAAGALDGDGQTDIVLAAPWASDAGTANGGLFYGLRGPLPTSGEIAVSGETADLVVRGADAGGGNGGASLVLADTDGDGVADLHVGLPDTAPMGRRSVGAVFVVRGPLLAALPTLTPSPTATPPATDTASPAPSPTDTASPAPSPTVTATASPTNTTQPTPTPSATAQLSPTATATRDPTATPPSATSSPSPSPAGGGDVLYLPFGLKPRRSSR